MRICLGLGDSGGKLRFQCYDGLDHVAGRKTRLDAWSRPIAAGAANGAAAAPAGQLAGLSLSALGRSRSGDTSAALSGSRCGDAGPTRGSSRTAALRRSGDAGAAGGLRCGAALSGSRCGDAGPTRGSSRAGALGRGGDAGAAGRGRCRPALDRSSRATRGGGGAAFGGRGRGGALSGNRSRSAGGRRVGGRAEQRERAAGGGQADETGNGELLGVHDVLPDCRVDLAHHRT